MGERLVVQFARGARRNEPHAYQERSAPRPRRTPFRMNITNLPVDTSWQVSIYPPSKAVSGLSMGIRFLIWLLCVTTLSDLVTCCEPFLAFLSSSVPLSPLQIAWDLPFGFLVPSDVSGPRGCLLWFF
jgi:hypothetical protein